MMKKRRVISALLLFITCIQLFAMNTYATGSTTEDTTTGTAQSSSHISDSATDNEALDAASTDTSDVVDATSSAQEVEDIINPKKPTTESPKDACDSIVEINVLFIDDNEVRHMVTCGVGFLLETDGGDQYVVSTKDIVSPTKSTREAVYKQLGIPNEDDAWDKIDLKIEVAYEGDVATTASVAYSSKEMNLAVLKLDDKVYNRTPLTILIDDEESSDIRAFKEADDVYALGFPNMSKILDDAISYFTTEDVVTLSGKITNVTRKNSSEVILQTVAMQSSMYGGPLVNDHGLLIGMNTLDMEGNYYISISSNSIMKVLKAVGLETVDCMTASEYDEYLNPPEQEESNTGDENTEEEKVVEVIPKKVYLIIYGLIGLILITLIVLIVIVIRSSKPRKKSKKQLQKEKEEAIMSGSRFDDVQGGSDIDNPAASSEFISKTRSQDLRSSAPISGDMSMAPMKDNNPSANIAPEVGETTVLSAGSEIAPNSYAIGTLISKRTGENIVIDKPIYRIGKNENYNDYCIRNNTAVSRMHAEIHATMQGAVIVDVGSTNGTFVSGNRIPQGQQIPLHPGNVISFGDEEFEFRN
jgi:cytoskeletal protein RodZ